MTTQTDNIKACMDWLETSPFEVTVSSMTSGFIHAKFLIPAEAADEQKTEDEK